MLHWFEGEIISYDDPIGGDPVHRATVRELTQGVEIRNVQMPLVSSQQNLPKIGSRIAFYRDTAATAKFGILLSDPRPISSPISIETADKAVQDGEPVFNQGEIALSALGDDDGFSSTEGGILWLRNTGDASLISGSYQQKIIASDSTDSVDIQGTNIDIHVDGNVIASHFINMDSQAFTGITSLSLGLRNPTTGVYVTRLKCDQLGAFTLGAEDPVLGTLLSGISYNLIPSLPLGPFIVPEIKLMSIPLLSQVTTNPLGTSINGPTITLAGPAALVGVAAPAVLVNILSAATQITSLVNIVGATAITGTTFIDGVTTINGATAITGATSINGATAITGATSIVGLLSITAPAVFSFTGPVTPATSPQAAVAGITHQVPVLVGAVPMWLALRTGAGWV